MGIEKEKGSFPLSNNYLDDAFTLKHLLDLEKNSQNSTLTENLIFLILLQVPHLR